MSYRNPRYSWAHALRDAPIPSADYGADFDGAVACDDGSYPGRLHDSRIGTRFLFDTETTDHWIAVDLGVDLPSYSRLLIPADHTLGNADYVVEESDTPDFSGTVNALASGTFPGNSALIDVTLTPSALQFLRLRIPTEGQWALAELWFTNTETTVRGVSPTEWSDDKVTNVNATRLTGGPTFANRRGPALRQVRYVYNGIGPTDADVLRRLRDETLDGSLAFWIERADTAHAPLLVLLDAQLSLKQAGRDPRATGEKYRALISATEQTA